MLSRHSVIINKSQVYYWERNPQATKVILFVHGFKGNHKGLTDVSEYFDNYRTILVDLPGYGDSEPMHRKHSIKNYALVLQELMQQLNIPKFDLVGHSYGASIAIVFAASSPHSLNNLVLISPGLPDDSWGGMLAKSQLMLTQKMPYAIQKAWLTSPLIEVLSTYLLVKTVSHKRRMELLHSGIRNAKKQYPHVILQGLSSFLATPLMSIAKFISVPTFVLAGEFDIITSLKSQVILSQLIPNAKLEMIPDMGHLAPIERPRTVGRMIHEFLNHQSPQLYPQFTPIKAELPEIKVQKQFTHPKYF